MRPALHVCNLIASEPSPVSACRQEPSLLLLTLLDGSLLALDQDLGTVLWSLDLGSPLLSSSGTWQETSPDTKKPVSRSILPGADGSLYIFTDSLGASQALEVCHKSAYAFAKQVKDAEFAG